MTPTYSIVRQTPTTEDYARIIKAVGWRPRQPEAVKIALRNSCFSVCAVSDDVVVGFGRVIGDGGIHLYVTDVVVLPEFQHHGIGTAIVAAITRWVEEFPFSNTIVAVLPTPGLASFYERHGYKIQPGHSPAMSRWINHKAA